MKTATKLIAIVLAFTIVGAGAYALLPGKGDGIMPPGGDGPGGDDGKPGDNTSKLTDPIAPVHHPVHVEAGDAVLSVELSYPHQDDEGAEYLWNHGYEFIVSTTGDWKGRAVLKIFAERADPIGPKCLVITYGEDGALVNWHFDEEQGASHLSGDAQVWMANGTMDRADRLSIIFNRTGDFTLTFQVFDADSGEPLSAPETAGPLEVPATGGLEFRVLGTEWKKMEIDNTTYFAVLINVTNGWNVRYDVDAGYLSLSDGEDDVPVSGNVTSFTAQSLAAGQSAQFHAFFLIEGDGEDFELVYAEPGRPPVDIPLS